MSEVLQSRPPASRGRSSTRGGRGGSSLGTRQTYGTARSSNGNINVSYSSAEDQGELSQLRKKYGNKVDKLEEMFPDWTPEDLAFTLEENSGDLENTITKISEGSASQWEVQKKSKDPRPRVQDRPPTGANDSSRSTTTRGSFEGTRGNRGRGGAAHEPPRSGRGARSRGGASANGIARPPKSSSEDPSTWETVEAEAEGVEESKKKSEPSGAPPVAPVTAQSRAIPDKTTSTWAGLFRSAPQSIPIQKKMLPSKQVSPPSAPVSAPEPQAAPEPKEPEPTVEVSPPQEPIPELPDISVPQVEVSIVTPAAEPEPELELEPEPEPEVKQEVPVASVPVVPAVPTVLAVPAVPAVPAILATPTTPATPVIPAVPAIPIPEVKETVPSPQSQQPLTEDNLEKIEDVAPPAPTTTQASTIASPAPTPSAVASIAPPPVQPIATTPRTAHAAVVMPKGTPKMRSRVMIQQEPVIMPSSHNAVEHATLQFGSMGLNGDDEDEVEQAETVSQPPQPSPVPQPVAALPPTGPAQLPVSQPPVTETVPTPRQAPGLPVHPQVAPQQPNSQPPVAPQSMTQQQHLSQHIPGQYSRYEIPNSQQQPQAKPFDTFGPPTQQQPAPQPQPQPQQSQVQPPQSQPQVYAGYTPSQLQPHQPPSHIGVGVSTTPDQQHQYSNYYDRTQPPGFGNLYNSSYMQQGQSQQDAGANQQRASSGLGGAGDVLGQVPTSAPAPGQVQQPTSRYGAAQAGEQSSGHATPSPAITAAQQTSQPHQPGLAQYPGGMPAYAYQHPYYNQFMHQSYYNHPSPFGKQQGIYGYPQAYMSPQYSDHSSTPAGLGGFGTTSTQGRESVGLGDYGRMNATASQQQPQQSFPQHSSAGAYNNSSNIPNFLNSRGGGLPEQQQLGGGVGQQQVTQQAQNDESMKFGENKPPTGPSSTPSIAGQPGRPGSATSGANMGPQHGAQTPASAYGAHLNHNLHGQQSQYGVGQGQSATGQYSVYAYPQYSQSNQRHAGAGGWGGGGYTH